jgi:acetoin utilization deacetylase AcuC-like enzyme
MNRIELALQTAFSFSDDATTGIFSADVFLEHDRLGHPEGPSRLAALATAIQNSSAKPSLRRFHFPFGEFSLEDVWVNALSPVHDQAHLESLFRNLGRAEYISTSRWSPYGGPWAKEAVFKSAVGTSELAIEIAKGRLKNGYSLVRPPGHHAGRSFSDSYCLINNAALAAKLVSQLSQKTVVILDLDVHHGNGTENIFFESSEVSYISLHQEEWPFTGRTEKTGHGEGLGHNFNLPLPVGSKGDVWLRAFDNFVIPAVEKTQPFMMIVSMGYDTHWRDPQGSMLLSTADQLALTARVRKLAEKVCRGRVLFVLEGGYDREATASGILNTLGDLADSQERILVDKYGAPPRSSVDETRRQASRADESISLALSTHCL